MAATESNSGSFDDTSQVEKSRPFELRKALEQARDLDQQHDLAREMAANLFETNPVAAAEFVGSLEEPLNFQMAAALASFWAGKDVLSAAEWVKSLPPGPSRTHALISICADWAATDPVAAAEFVLNSSESDFPTGGAFTSDFSGLQATNTAASEIRSRLLSNIGAGWAATDSRDALAWLSHLPSDADRDSLLAGITSSFAENSPRDAATLVALMSAGPKQNEAALTVLLQWAQSDPNTAADWLKLFPASEFREKALLNLTDALAEHEQTGLDEGDKAGPMVR